MEKSEMRKKHGQIKIKNSEKPVFLQFCFFFCTGLIIQQLMLRQFPFAAVRVNPSFKLRMLKCMAMDPCSSLGFLMAVMSVFNSESSEEKLLSMASWD